MNGIYEVYKLTSAGVRNSILTDYESLEGHLNWSKNSQFTLKGKCLGTVPLAMGNRIAIVRNLEQIFSGIVTEVNISCDDTANSVKEWEAVIDDDAVVLDWRYVFASTAGTAPKNIEVAEDVFDKWPASDTASAHDRMLYYINRHAGSSAHSSRKLVTVSEDWDSTRGETGQSAYHIKKLTDALSEIGDADGLYCKVSTNSSGTRILTIPESRDRTSAIVVGPEFGNVSAWEVSRRYPKFNAVWVISGVTSTDNGDDTTTEERVWVYAEDSTSVSTYGRIESVVTKSDIKIVYEDEDNSDIVEVTEAEVTAMLELEAQNQLKEAAATEKWTVTMMEIADCAFMDDWQVGDEVQCVIDGDSFTGLIETVDITYQKGVELVTPTIGDVETGLYGDLYKMLRGIDRRLRREEEK